MKKIKPLIIILICFQIFLFNLLSAQSSSIDKALGELIPPSPESCSLGEMAEIPVSYYTGTPNISIPLWEVKYCDIVMPINISYKASGIRVTDNSGWVGLGWNLNAGGVITRTVRGFPDEKTNGYYYSESFDNNNFQPDDEDGFYTYSPSDTMLMYTTNGIYDTEPDLFYFNFLDFSGSFCFDGNGGILMKSLRNIIIVPTFSGSNIISWKVTSENGFEFSFENKERLHYTSDCGDKEINPTYNSTWYLTKVLSPIGNYISLSYDSVNYGYSTPANKQKLYDSKYNTVLDTYTCSNSSSFTSYQLREIESANCLVEFIPSNDTADDLGREVLDKILIKDKLNGDSIIKELDFTYSYSGTIQEVGFTLTGVCFSIQ